MSGRVAAALVVVVAAACTTPRAPTEVAYETRARAGERLAGPGVVDPVERAGAHDPRDSVRARADEVKSRARTLADRATAQRVDRWWREDLGTVDERATRLFERMEILDEMERRGEDIDVERQWDGVFAEVQDLLAALDELEDDLARAEGPAGGTAKAAAP